jgi:hypothetical protein
MREILSGIGLSSDVYVYPIEKEPIIKIYLFDSARKIDLIYRDSEKIIIKLDTDPETVFVVTKNYIAELRNIIVVYVLKNYDEFDLDKLRFDIDIEYYEYDDDYDYQFYLKIQTE